jgi:Domain of unknown function (DUF397)
VPLLDATWRKSTRSNNNGSCVEIRRVKATIEMRDTKDQSGPVLMFRTEVWRDFMGAISEGEFDRR